MESWGASWPAAADARVIVIMWKDIGIVVIIIAIAAATHQRCCGSAGARRHPRRTLCRRHAAWSQA